MHCLKLQSHHQRYIAPWFGHVDEAVITGVVVISAVEQIVGMKGNVDLASMQWYLLTCREVQRPMAVGRLFWGKYFSVPSADQGVLKGSV